ncbi:MFS family permease [Desulfitispora alkaliphila]|uniref:MFS transporter n=1 Tax=Desulfitispora alkaliphila TaxID=622674 RepID=UPI003D24FE24
MTKYNWTRFYLGALCTFTLFFAYLTILPMYAIELGGTEFDSGFQTTLFFIAAVLMRFYFGPMTDKYGRRLPLLIGVFAFATAPLLFYFVESVWGLAIARIYQAIGLASFFTSGGSLVADMAPEGKIGTYMGYYRIVNTSALLIGPMVAMFLINQASYEVWFLTSLGIGALAFGLMYSVKTPGLPVKNDKSNINTGKSRLELIIKNKEVWPIYLGIAIVASCYGVIMTFCTIYVSQTTDIGNPGIYFTYFALTGIAANLAVGYVSDRWGSKKAAWPCAVLIGLGTISLYVLPMQPLMFFVSSALAGAGFAGGLLAFISWLVETADPKARATALALQESTIDISVATVTFAVGAVSVWIGLSLSFLLMGLIALIPALYYLAASTQLSYKFR